MIGWPPIFQAIFHSVSDARDATTFNIHPRGSCDIEIESVNITLRF